MARKALNPFEKAQNAHNNLTGNVPVGRTALMNSLGKVETAGNVAVKAQELGVIKFAIAMTEINNHALAINDAGNVKPPLSEAQTAAIGAKNDMLQIFIENDPGATAEPVPADTGSIPTNARKGA